jgi:hypothetical protein
MRRLNIGLMLIGRMAATRLLVRVTRSPYSEQVGAHVLRPARSDL